MGTLFALGLIYFAPTCVAILRNHNNALAIAALNILLGWTVLGWIGAAVWAMTSNVKAPAPKKLTTTKPAIEDNLHTEGWNA